MKTCVLSLIISVSFVLQLLLYPVPASANRPWLAEWIKNQRLNQDGITYQQLVEKNYEQLGERERVILGNLTSQYGKIMISKVTHKTVRNTRGQLVDQLILGDKDGSAIIEVTDIPDEELLVKIITSQNKKDLQFRFYPEKMTVSEIKNFLGRADKGFQKQLFNPTASLRMLTLDQIQNLSELRKKSYYIGLQKVMNTAEEVSRSLNTAKKEAKVFSSWIEEAYAQLPSRRLNPPGGDACVVGGWSGRLLQGKCLVDEGGSSCSSGNGRATSVSCNPLIFGETDRCANFSEPASCPTTGEWNSAFRRAKGNERNFSIIRDRLKTAISDLVRKCQDPRNFVAKFEMATPWLHSAHAKGGEAELAPVGSVPGGRPVNQSNRPSVNSVAKPELAPLPSLGTASNDGIVSVGAGHCRNLEVRLNELDRLSCEGLEEHLQREFGCGQTLAPVVDRSTKGPLVGGSSEKGDTSIWPWVIGAGLLGFLLGYAAKRRRTVTQFVPNPIPGSTILVPNPVPNPIPGNPILIPNPVPTPVPIPMPGAPYTPPVRGVN